MDQPSTRRDHKSSTAAKYSQPSPVRNWVTSAAQTWSGPEGSKSRFTRSGALASPGLPLRHLRLACAPTRPERRIRRATRLRPQCTPAWASSPCTLGDP